MKRVQKNSLYAPTAVVALATVALSIFAVPQSAEAYPELTRHGYASCTACHVAPNGGGALTPYGRNLSRELLSTWGTEREPEVLHGALPKEWMESLESSKLRIGGDIRSVQTHRENQTVRAGQYFLMQANVEAVYDEGPWALSLSLGKLEDPRGKKEFRLIGSRFYGILRKGEHLAFRVGRFGTAFGLNLADHTLSIRRPLGLGPETDRDNAELSWIDEHNQFFLSFMQTAPNASTLDRETAGVFRYDRILNERSRVGLSLWQGDGGSSDNGTKFGRFMMAVHAIVNISHDWFFSGEIDRIDRMDNPGAGANLTQSQYAFLRLNYEPVRGIVPLFQIQHERGDVGLSATETNKYGLGLNFFPRPHFELFGVWNRVLKQSAWSDEAYLLFHYYL